MQNAKTLKDIGFLIDDFGDYRFVGKHQVFIARIVDYNGPVDFVDLLKESSKIDIRPSSPRFNHPLHITIKQCASEGSVLRAIEKYDIPTPQVDIVNDKK